MDVAAACAILYGTPDSTGMFGYTVPSYGRLSPSDNARARGRPT